MAETIQILLVDDNEDDYILTRDLLEETTDMEIVLDWSPDFEEALDAICRHEHDVILVDYRLGKRNGLELIRESMERNCKAAIILLTGQGERQVDYDAMEAGAADYLEKGGLNSRILERSIRYTLQQKRHAEQLEQKVEERTAELARSNEWLQAEVAERRRVEAELRVADRRKDEFLATLAHELRNPLVPIRNSLEIIRLAGHDPAVIRPGLATIERHVQTIVRLIDDLVDIARISRGAVQLRKERVTVERLIEGSVECVAPILERKGQRLTVKLPKERLEVEADPARLSQVITNLLNNAARYTAPGGAITLMAGRNDEELLIQVLDDGMGMPQEALSWIFDIFTQVNRSGDDPEGSMGIGLWLVASLVRLHGGRVEAASGGLGCGSEFRVYLPLMASSVHGVDAALTTSESNLK